MAKRGSYTRRGTRRHNRAERRQMDQTNRLLWGRELSRHCDRFFAERGLEVPKTSESFITDTHPACDVNSEFTRYEDPL